MLVATAVDGETAVLAFASDQVIICESNDWVQMEYVENLKGQQVQEGAEPGFLPLSPSLFFFYNNIKHRR